MIHHPVPLIWGEAMSRMISRRTSQSKSQQSLKLYLGLFRHWLCPWMICHWSISKHPEWAHPIQKLSHFLSPNSPGLLLSWVIANYISYNSKKQGDKQPRKYLLSWMSIPMKIPFWLRGRNHRSSKLKSTSQLNKKSTHTKSKTLEILRGYLNLEK